MNLEIEYLVDRIEHRDQLALFIKDHWGKFYPEENSNFFKEKFTHLNKEKLPFTLVGILNGKLIGSAAAIIGDDGEVWLKYVYVDPAERGKNIAFLLVNQIIKICENLGVSEIKLDTYYARGLYEKLGWKFIKTIEYRGQNADYMVKSLLPSMPLN